VVDTTLTAVEVGQLLRRAAAASASNDAIIAVVDRGGNVLGVRVEAGVSPAITTSPERLTFAVDGALAEARSAAFFSTDAAALTSRTVQFISQSTITQREVESDPNVTDPNSPLRGPGFVAPIGLKAHFPPNVMFKPSADFFEVEHTNRDSLVNPGPDRVKGTADDVLLPSRFDVNPAFIPPGQATSAPESYGLVSGIFPLAQSRGLGTLPGGVPLYKDGSLVGAIGVFFPGATGFATAENSSLNEGGSIRGLPDRSVEAESIAFAAAGGSRAAGVPIGKVGGVPPLPGFDLPFGRIDENGITLDIYGPGGIQGPRMLAALGRRLGAGNPDGGVDLPVDPSGQPLKGGALVPSGWLVAPHDGVGLSAADVLQIISQGIARASITRAAFRLPLDSRARDTFAVTDLTGQVLGLYRMPDSPVFAIDTAVAQARNDAYYADAALLQPIDQVPGVLPGVAFASRTIRYLAQPRFPEGIDGFPPGPFSILNDSGVPGTARQVGPPLPASAFASVQGYDAFHPDTNFRDPSDPLNQNGVAFFPGGVPLYKDFAGVGVRTLAGGLGVGGDGVDQSDFVAAGASVGYAPPAGVPRADFIFVRGVRLPYQKFPRNPTD
jgi:uncharacterized protein GlcG (DUF336 family)